MTFRKSILLLIGMGMIAALVGCSSNSHNSGGGGGGGSVTPAISVSATAASVVVGGMLSLTATITNDSSGANWSATCGSTTSGACGTFSAPNTASGTAVSYTAPAAVPPATVVITATVADSASVTASAQITITAVVIASNTYVFYASGEEFNNGGPNYYAVAGAVTIDANGDILAGEQDFNDGFAITANDQISAANTALVVDPTTGQGTLTITTTDTNLGGVNTASGVEEFAVQFVNASHALITQFDGSATSSGSLDLQTLANASGNFAFAITGVNPSYDSVAFGGVYNAGSSSVAGTLDINDDDGGVLRGSAFSATAGTTDGFGRTVITGVTNPSYAAAMGVAAPITFVSYVVGPEVLRIIDIDTTDSAIGSAYGQGSGAFTNASLTNDVFTLLGQWDEMYATLGGFGTDSNGNITGGGADDNELDNGIQQATQSITGTYSIPSNGYGDISLTWTVSAGTTPDVSLLGLYMVDPTLNINDPNNTTSADVGGALVVDMDPGLPGGMGVITPITSGSFSGTYVAAFQNFNTFNSSVCNFCEFDMVSQGTMNAAVTPTLSLTGDDSDPFGTWDGIAAAESTGDTFTSNPLNVASGVYSMSQSNSPQNQIEATINFAVTGGPGSLDADIYQASGTTLYWLEFDNNGVFLGPIVAQGSLTGLAAARKPAGKTQPKTNIKPIKGLGGTLR